MYLYCEHYIYTPAEKCQKEEAEFWPDSVVPAYSKLCLEWMIVANVIKIEIFYYMAWHMNVVCTMYVTQSWCYIRHSVTAVERVHLPCPSQPWCNQSSVVDWAQSTNYNPSPLQTQSNLSVLAPERYPPGSWLCKPYGSPYLGRTTARS